MFLLTFFLMSSAKAAQEAVAVTEGGLVYRNPDFDSKVIGSLRQGETYFISTRKFNSAFHRIRLRQGVLGYVADVDVSTGKTSPKPAPGIFKDAEEEQRSARPERPRFMREKTLLGLVGGSVDYAEVFAKREYRSSTTMLGAKLTTPFGVFDGPFLFDAQILMSLSPPEFFKRLSTIEPQGNVFLGSLVIQYPMLEFSGRRGLFYIGAGPVVAYSSVLVEFQSSKLLLDEVRAGGVLVTGLAFDLSNAKVILKIEPKYYVEKSNYMGLEAALQFGF